MTTKSSKIEEALPFDLKAFFPYLVRIFYSDVSSSISDIYKDLYGITTAEWRCMVIIGPEGSLTANEIVSVSSLDKVAVSRAISRMSKQGLLSVVTNQGDGRSKLLSLSTKGVEIYADLIPRVQDIEDALLEGITPAQLDQFVSTMQRIRENRQKLTKTGQKT